MGFTELTDDRVPERGITPFFLLVDRSQSMADVEPVLNEVLENIVDDLIHEPAVKMSGQLGVITFGDEATVDIPVGAINAGLTAPTISTGGRTNYAAAFSLLREEMRRAIRVNTEGDSSTRRPVVFFLTDGEPQPIDQPWREQLRALVDEPFAPRIFTFGLGTADDRVLGQVATDEAWKYDNLDRATISRALKEWASVFVGTVVGTLGAAQGPVASVPPQGARSLPVIPID